MTVTVSRMFKAGVFYHKPVFFDWHYKEILGKKYINDNTLRIIDNMKPKLCQGGEICTDSINLRQ